MAQRSSDRWGCDRFPRRRADRLQTVVGWAVVAAVNGDQMTRDARLPLVAGDVVAFLSADAGG